MKIGDNLKVKATPQQLEQVGIDEDEIIGDSVKVNFIYSTGYVRVKWASPNYGLIEYDIPRWLLTKKD